MKFLSMLNVYLLKTYLYKTGYIYIFKLINEIELMKVRLDEDIGHVSQFFYNYFVICILIKKKKTFRF